MSDTQPTPLQDAVLHLPATVTIQLPKTPGWAALFTNAGLDDHRQYLAAQRRRYMSGPDRYERQIARIYRIPPRALGLTPPPLPIDGHAYHQRQRNRIKRRRRR